MVSRLLKDLHSAIVRHNPRPTRIMVASLHHMNLQDEFGDRITPTPYRLGELRIANVPVFPSSKLGHDEFAFIYKAPSKW